MDTEYPQNCHEDGCQNNRGGPAAAGEGCYSDHTNTSIPHAEPSSELRDTDTNDGKNSEQMADRKKTMCRTVRSKYQNVCEVYTAQQFEPEGFGCDTKTDYR